MPAEGRARSPQAPPTGVANLVGSGDPRTVGKLFVGTALLFLLVAGGAGLTAGFDRAVETTDAFLGEAANQVYALYAVTGLFLVVLPLLIGLATAIVPLQVGASTIAFPRASAAAYWTYLTAGGLIFASFALDGGPFGNRPEPVELFIAGFIALLVALTVAVISVATTVLALRAPGMSLRRTPLFSWSMLVAGTVWTLTLPVLAGVMVLAYVDLRYGGEQFMGGADGLYDRLAWSFWQPTVYAFAIPALGIIADVVPVFAQRRHHRHKVAMALIGLFGALSFGAWAQLGATLDGSGSPAPWLHDGVWIAVSFLVLVPLLGLFGLWTTTLGLGRPRLRGPLVLALPAGLLVLLGVAAGAGTTIEDLAVDGTTWMTAQTNAVLIGTLLAAFAGLVYWAPKLYGKLVPEGLAGLGGVLVLLGALAYTIPDALSGLLDQSRFVTEAMGMATVKAADSDTVEVLNLISAIGGAVVVAGALAVIAALLRPRRGTEVADDPWSGHTLEWATASPPPVGNFAELPEITSEAPLYDARHAAAAGVAATETAS
ncbi:MAG TPA: cbb3-type cytochrome c oxidase subunit I [Acidimicrobiales bacterium]